MNLMSALFNKLNGSTTEERSYTEVSGATPSIAAERGAVYLCTTQVTSLTLSSLPDEGFFVVIFEAGSTPPQISAPNYLVYRQGDEVEKNKINELNINCFKVGVDRFAQALMAAFDKPLVS